MGMTRKRAAIRSVQHPVPSGILLLLMLHLSAGAQPVYTLEELLALGRERNYTLLSLQAEQQMGQADLRDQGRWANPEVEFGIGTGRPFAGGDDRSLRGIGVQQYLENPLTRHHRLAGLRTRLEATAEGIRLAGLEVDFEIREHFYGVLLLQERLELARLHAGALTSMRRVVEARAELGEVRPLEALRLRVEEMRAINQVEAAELELEHYRRHLNTFLGELLPADYVLRGELMAEQTVPLLEELLEQTLPRHPSLRQLGRRIEAAGHDLSAARTGWLPAPTLSARSGREMDGRVSTVGIGLPLPLWNRSEAAAERERQQLRLLELQEQALRLELRAQLLIHHNQVRIARRTIDLFQQGLLDLARTSIEIAEAGYRAGEISALEYLDARRTYYTLQIEYQQALYDWNVQRAALVRAAGGEVL